MKQYSVTDLFHFSWKDLSTEQMAKLIMLKQKREYCLRDNDHQSAGHWSIMILRELRKNKSAVADLNVAQAVDCINNILSVKSTREPKYYLSEPWFFFPAVSNPLFPAPDDLMSNLCFHQLVYADSLFSKYLITDYHDRRAFPSQDPSELAEAYLLDLFAVLYTPAEIFDESKIEERAALLKKVLKEHDKLVIFHTYANIKQYITQQRCPVLFNYTEPDPEEPAQEQPEDVEPPYTGQMWQNLLYDLAETPAFPGLDKAKNAKVLTALDYLEKKAIDVKNFKANNQHEEV
jgi:hypothetical protein